MTAHLVRLNPGRCGQTLVNKVNQVVVWVADASVTAEADARAAAAAAAAQPGPSGHWKDAVVTELNEAGLASPVLGRTVD